MSSSFCLSLCIIKNSFSKMFHIFSCSWNVSKEKKNIKSMLQRMSSSYTTIEYLILGIHCLVGWWKMMKNDGEKKSLASYRFEMDKVNLEWWVRFICVQLLVRRYKKCCMTSGIWEGFYIINNIIQSFFIHDWAALDLFVI